MMKKEGLRSMVVESVCARGLLAGVALPAADAPPTVVDSLACVKPSASQGAPCTLVPSVLLKKAVSHSRISEPRTLECSLNSRTGAWTLFGLL